MMRLAGCVQLVDVARRLLSDVFGASQRGRRSSADRSHRCVVCTAWRRRIDLDLDPPHVRGRSIQTTSKEGWIRPMRIHMYEPKYCSTYQVSAVMITAERLTSWYCSEFAVSVQFLPAVWLFE